VSLQISLLNIFIKKGYLTVTKKIGLRLKEKKVKTMFLMRHSNVQPDGGSPSELDGTILLTPNHGTLSPSKAWCGGPSSTHKKLEMKLLPPKENS